LAADDLLADPRSTHGAPQNGGIATWQEHPAVFPLKTLAMRRVLRVLQISLVSLLALMGFAGALFWYFVYSSAPEVPQLSGTLAKASIDAGGVRRTYTTYVPRGLPKGSPLVVVMHGSGENGARIRVETGYGFDRLA